MHLEQFRESYIATLMSYIEMEYDNIPSEVTPEMDRFFNDCFDRRSCYPNAAGLFYDNFLRAKAA